MRSRVAFALAVALALPAWAQHQAGHGGSAGHSGGAVHAGGAVHGGSYGHSGYQRQGNAGRAPSYSGQVGLQQPSSFLAPGRFPMPGGPQPPARAGVPLPYRGRNFTGGGYPHGPGYPGRDPHRSPYRGHGHDRRRHGRGSYGYYPGYVYPYPYAGDPGFYDWGATDYSENEQGENGDVPPEQGAEYGYGPEAPYPPGGDVPYPQQQEDAQRGPSAPPVGPQRQEYHFATSSPSAPTPIASKPLTVIFKGGRAPQKMQNYMVTSTALTNLDGEQFEKIPLDQIDVAATQLANRSSGIDFQVPVPTHD